MSDEIGVLALTRRTHEMRVLAALRTRGPSSRAQLAEATRLSRTTLSEIVGDLLARGAVVVTETDAAQRRGSGRPAALLALDPGSAQFLGLDFGHRRVALAIAGASHEVVAVGEAGYDERSTWPERAALAITLARELAAEQRLHFGALQGVAAGVTGRRRDEAEPIVADALAEAFGVDAIVDNNVRFAGLAEAGERGRPFAHALYLQLGDGVGGAVVVDGHLHQGAGRSAGEFGHVVVDPGGALCRCGKRGCLETIARLEALEGASVEDLDRVARGVGEVLGAASMVLDPELIVIGGRVVDEHPSLLARIEQAVRDRAGGSAGQLPEIRAAVCGPFAGARGSLIAAIHESPLLAGYDLAISAGSPRQRSGRAAG
ncbi:ROK family transcriptional regulator [Brachybacterium sp.]|uniref:ROK family transcriptional regulator n=1 Tax=Brachybacterium sp. TaxID=1891286 RepID=UPI002ED0477C